MGQTFSTVPPHLVRIHPHTPSQVCCDRSVWLPLTNNASRNSWDPFESSDTFHLFFSNIFYTKKTPERHVTIHSMLVFQKLFCTSNKLLIETCKMWAVARSRWMWNPWIYLPLEMEHPTWQTKKMVPCWFSGCTFYKCTENWKLLTLETGPLKMCIPGERCESS